MSKRNKNQTKPNTLNLVLNPQKPEPTPFPAKKLPQVGVVISCNNNINTIEKAINSVIEQDYVNKEVVVIDDASVDGSWDKICELIGQPGDKEDFISNGKIEDVPIIAIRHEFQTGIAGVMLAGANIVWKNVELIGILNGHDEYLPGKITQSINSVSDIIDKVGLIYSDYHTNIGNSPVTIYQESFTRDRLTINVPFGDSVLVTKTSLEVVGMVNPNMGDDALYDLWLRITEKFVAIHVPEVLTKELRLNAETRT